MMRAAYTDRRIVLGVLVALSSGCGAFDIRASDGEPGWMRWIAETVRENEVEDGARQLQPPADLMREGRIENGFLLYQGLCVSCHGAPGVEPGLVARGIVPPPPPLHEPARALPRPPEQVFFIAKHGIVRTGMGAFGKTQPDAALWAVAAFVEHMRGMSAEAYRQMAERNLIQVQGGACPQ